MKALLYAVLSLLLSACGGGGSSSEPIPTPPPTEQTPEMVFGENKFDESKLG